MKKLDFKIWDNDSNSDNDLPLFIDTNNLIIKNKENIPLIDILFYTKGTKLDSLFFKKYGGTETVEQFNIIKKILPLVLIFNEINDITKIENGTLIKFPDINELTNNIYYFDNETIPGINTNNNINSNNSTNIKKINIDKLTGLSGINIELEKIQYDKNNGIIYF